VGWGAQSPLPQELYGKKRKEGGTRRRKWELKEGEGDEHPKRQIVDPPL